MRFKLPVALLSSVVVATLANSAHALTFNITYDNSLSAYPELTQLKTAVNYVANEFSTAYTNNVTLNLTIAGDSGPSVLGYSSANYEYQGYTYAQIRTALLANTPSDAANVPIIDPTLIARAPAAAASIASPAPTPKHSVSPSKTPPPIVTAPSPSALPMPTPSIPTTAPAAAPVRSISSAPPNTNSQNSWVANPSCPKPPTGATVPSTFSATPPPRSATLTTPQTPMETPLAPIFRSTMAPLTSWPSTTSLAATFTTGQVKTTTRTTHLAPPMTLNPSPLSMAKLSSPSAGFPPLPRNLPPSHSSPSEAHPSSCAAAETSNHFPPAPLNLKTQSANASCLFLSRMLKVLPSTPAAFPQTRFAPFNVPYSIAILHPPSLPYCHLVPLIIRPFPCPSV